MTLHGTMGHIKGSKARARNVLQHGVGNFVREIDLSHLGEEQRKRAEAMRARLIKMGEEHTNVGYSLEG